MASSAPNPWFDWGYVRDNRQDILSALEHHVTLTVETVVIATLVALPLAVLARRRRWLRGPLLGVAGVLYTIPSLAFFAVLAPWSGIGARTVLIGLVVYALLILIRNTLVGLDGVPDDVREAARGLGYGPVRMLLQVELPVALPAVLTGIRLATVSTVALVTVGVVVGYGGLGQLILRGFNNNFYRAEIFTNSLLCVLLALVLDLLLLGASRLLTPWARGRA
ncbi:osmoprotectant transport system permease protein [Motilibacter rhizosphaerae]|uniref:Osmoprotectant transport system permease protein n=1 Tax=Motilibacter rhizosphaerae TaxID=598652 RepID=A0A4V2F2S1_9ACTN|nr:ABC transporter permease [Motilibacter rhizosphaerae]RZS79436.1 osmoprotectant transport system permease protein [Motilibacter rhizosphaerae]